MSSITEFLNLNDSSTIEYCSNLNLNIICDTKGTVNGSNEEKIKLSKNERRFAKKRKQNGKARVKQHQKNEDLAVENDTKRLKETSYSVTEEEGKMKEDEAAKTFVSSRRCHDKKLLNDVQIRAKYMKEFHAAPFEIDARNKAISKISPSVKSSHLFLEKEKDIFRTLGIDERISNVLQKNFGFENPTTIQAKVIPFMLSNDTINKNLLIQSETGSGKTFAYIVPILQLIAAEEFVAENRLKCGIRCIILCPTRELTTQTYKISKTLCQSTFSWIVPGVLSGGEKRKSEKARLRKGISILVSTPGRLLDHLKKTECLIQSISSNNKLGWVVLDEVDRLLDMGLGGQIKSIVNILRDLVTQNSSSNKECWRNILLSATVTNEIQKLASDTFGGDSKTWTRINSVILQEKKPTTKSNNASNVSDNVELKLSDATPPQLAQFHMIVSAKLRLAALIGFLVTRLKKKDRIVVFMATCNQVDFYYRLFSIMDNILDDQQELDEESDGIFGDACDLYKIHGNLEKSQRNLILSNFSEVKPRTESKKGSVLIATDVVARGLNIPDVDWILQYDAPCEMADYVHRVGRAARAGKPGHSLIFLLPSETQYLEALKIRGLKETTPLSLSSTLQQAFSSCQVISNQEMSHNKNFSKRKKISTFNAEAFAAAVQKRSEDVVCQHIKSNENKSLLASARSAYTSYVRAYPAKEKAVRYIFSARALHLGHVARSFALKSTPRQIVKQSYK